MTTKQWMLIILAIMLGAFSLYLNRDSFAKDNIQVYHRSRPARFVMGGSTADSELESVMFGFDRQLKLTSLKMVPIDALKTNKYAHPVWELVSDSNSVPVKDFTYGMDIGGMRPPIEGLTPEPLEPGVPYRLLVQAGKQKITHDFTLQPLSP
jgi:hypothetical protein